MVEFDQNPPIKGTQPLAVDGVGNGVQSPLTAVERLERGDRDGGEPARRMKFEREVSDEHGNRDALQPRTEAKILGLGGREPNPDAMGSRRFVWRRGLFPLVGEGMAQCKSKNLGLCGQCLQGRQIEGDDPTLADRVLDLGEVGFDARKLMVRLQVERRREVGQGALEEEDAEKGGDWKTEGTFCSRI